ncbi:ATP-dependent RNA helicase DeaD [Vigna unguiculata]|uniref:ATP-dependent RNA helicase DeaD n=1 Tax=Vigna unguiculata TaxID=3917 RepID=A0A4D6L4W3_VIGUN|nr:ATP-dependent RNA helicase DeaD [Vigna unguiculata]
MTLEHALLRVVLEPAMQGRDMIGRARTGIGKTLAFGIPILDRIIQLNAKHGQFNYGVDIVVGTPGRIIDLLNRRALNLKDVKFVVLDEADQMLQVGFQ